MDDLFQFNPLRSFSLPFRIAQGDESDRLNVFRDPKNLFYLKFIKSANPAGSKAEARSHRHHVSSRQRGVIPSVLSFPGIETEDQDNGGLFDMGKFNKEESSHLPNLFPRLRIRHDNEMPRLEVYRSRCPSPSLKDLEKKISWNGLVQIDPDRPSGF